MLKEVRGKEAEEVREGNKVELTVLVLEEVKDLDLNFDHQLLHKKSILIIWFKINTCNRLSCRVPQHQLQCIQLDLTSKL